MSLQEKIKTRRMGRDFLFFFPACRKNVDMVYKINFLFLAKQHCLSWTAPAFIPCPRNKIEGLFSPVDPCNYLEKPFFVGSRGSKGGPGSTWSHWLHWDIPAPSTGHTMLPFRPGKLMENSWKTHGKSFSSLSPARQRQGQDEVWECTWSSSNSWSKWSFFW